MNILKKDGRLEIFDYTKIVVSIKNAARDSNQLLNESDLKVLARDVIKTIENIRRDSLETSSYEVIGVIFEVLKRDGFSNVLKSYIEFEK